MHGAFDESSVRLARALQRPPEHVERALQDVGVDAPYLSRALLDGDPQGAIDAVSQRLGVTSRDLVMALVRSAEGDLRSAPSSSSAGASADAVHDFVSRRLPTLLTRAAVASALAGLGLAAFASLALWNPELFRALLVYAAAAFVGLAAVLLLVGAWRMRRAASVLRRLRARGPSAKR